MIRFGPAGWRGIIAEEITVASVRRVASALARALQEAKISRRGVVVGYDTRFLSDRFAREAAAVLSAHGVPVALATGPAPTPAIACAVAASRRAAGVSITAGQDPAEWSGMKIVDPSGGPGLLRAVERLAHEAPPAAGATRRAAPVRARDLRSGYLKALRSRVRHRAIRGARLKIGCDPRHGASIGCLDVILKSLSRSLTVLHGDPHPEFGGGGPACGEAQLKPLARLVRRGGLHLGLATDGDGERFGILDAGGFFVAPNLFLAILADYLIEKRRLPGGVARSVATTHLLDAVCALHGRPVYETPLGGAALAEHLKSRRAFLACEENGSLGLAGHAPERDGTLAALLAAELVAARRRTLREQIALLFRKVGPLHGRRIDYHTDAGARDRLLRRLEEVPSAFAGKRVARCDTTDGRKLTLSDGAWVLFRPSGSEPLVSLYAEARTPRDLEALLESGRDLITGP